MNPTKFTAISKMGPIHSLKAAQKVTGCITVLSRFISRLGERGLPLYQLLKKTNNFTWTDKAKTRSTS